MTNFGSTRLCVSKATITRMNVGSLLPLSASCVPRLRQALAGGRGLVTLDMNGLLPGNLSSSVFRRTLFGQSFEVGEIQAYRREKSGSRHAQWARQNKMIPGIIYGPDESGKRAPVELVYVREADLRREVNKRSACFTNTLYDIVLDGKKYRVLPRDFAVHPFRPKALCINWLRYRVGAYPGVRVDIPLKGFNQERCPAYKEGGWLMELNYKLPVYASGPAIPDYLMMDLRGMRIGEKVMASQIELNEGLRLRTRVHDFAVAKFVGSRRGAEEEGAAAAEGAAAGGAAAKPAAAGGAAPKAAAGGEAKKA